MRALYAAILFAILGGALTKKFTEDMLTSYDKACLQELGLTSNIVVDNIDDNFNSTEGNADYNKFTECWFRKVGIIDENNAFNCNNDAVQHMVNFISIVNPDIEEKNETAVDAIEACKDTAGQDVGDRLVKFTNCCIKFITNVQ